MDFIKDQLAGSTKVVTWVSSGASPSAISTAIFTSSEALVSSMSMTSSGNGHYYANITMPDSNGIYVNEFNATISGDLYKKRFAFRVIKGETT